MKKIFLIGTLLLLCAIAIIGILRVKGSVQGSAKEIKPKIANKVISDSEVQLKRAMRAQWESRATLLRGYVICSINDSRDLLEAKNKLLKNASDLGASIQPYYGYFAGGILTGFLKNDVLLTEKVILVAKTGDKNKLDQATKKWYSNASLLAGFFAIPHNQTIEELKGMLYKHLDLTMGEIEAILNKQGTNDLDYYEKDRTHMLMFSDVLTDGIVRQFPDKFKE
jgi:hypothetical protein